MNDDVLESESLSRECYQALSPAKLKNKTTPQLQVLTPITIVV